MTTELRPMPNKSLSEWIEGVGRYYEQSRMKADDSQEVAAEKARTSTETSFPDGTPAAGQLVYDVVAVTPGVSNEVIGYLWITQIEDGGDAWWVSDIKIDENRRGQGHGRAAMQLAETAAAEHGAVTLGLNVFGYNTVARGLYESLGYETTAVQMRKQVSVQ